MFNIRVKEIASNPDSLTQTRVVEGAAAERCSGEAKMWRGGLEIAALHHMSYSPNSLKGVM